MPRSRSPLIVSAATSSASRAPNITATCSVRLTVSRFSRKLIPSLVAPRYVITLARTLNANSSSSPRPPIHRSRSS